MSEPARTFVVGCPRSGTTLLQAMLASHPEVFSFPETHYFRKIRGRFAGLPWRVASPRAARNQLWQVAADLDVPDISLSFWHLGLSARAYELAFVQAVDSACSRAGKSMWVDKSPVHLHFIEDIMAAVPDARFVHILRNGHSVVSSFYAICLERPDWVRQVLKGNPVLNMQRDGDDFRVLDAVVDRWNIDVGISAQWAGEPRHLVTTLERLLRDPRHELERVCRFLGLPFVEEMLDHTSAAEQVIGRRIVYPHMHGALEPLRSPDSSIRRDPLLPAAARRVHSRLGYGGDAERIVTSLQPEAFTRDYAA